METEFQSFKVSEFKGPKVQSFKSVNSLRSGRTRRPPLHKR